MNTSPLNLAAIPLFSTLEPEGLEALAARGTPRTFLRGQLLLKQGAASNVMYVIRDGAVRVTRQADGNTMALGVVGPGGIVGEIGLLDGLPRTATVTAVETTAVLELDADLVVEVMLGSRGTALTLLRMMSQRLRTMEELVSWYAAKDKQTS